MIRQWSSIYKDTTELIDASLTWYRSQICDRERVKLNISPSLSHSLFKINIYFYSIEISFSLFLSLVVFFKFPFVEWRIGRKIEHLEGTGCGIKRRETRIYRFQLFSRISRVFLWIEAERKNEAKEEKKKRGSRRWRRSCSRLRRAITQIIKPMNLKGAAATLIACNLSCVIHRNLRPAIVIENNAISLYFSTRLAPITRRPEE